MQLKTLFKILFNIYFIVSCKEDKTNKIQLQCKKLIANFNHLYKSFIMINDITGSIITCY
jgi:hypothetical protein